MMIKSDEYQLPLTVGGLGYYTVKFGGISFTMGSNYNVSIQDKRCSYWFVFGSSLTDEEMTTKTGRRPGSVYCKGWQIPIDWKEK
uniref:Uncharacterized protein n=1 Tax=Trichobilharzia regenti TaxID=157069 RepID=A0AA85KJW1_TRIRE|nr:unnamed protein product [Trichobilharzia regenti]